MAYISLRVEITREIRAVIIYSFIGAGIQLQLIERSSQRHIAHIQWDRQQCFHSCCNNSHAARSASGSRSSAEGVR